MYNKYITYPDPAFPVTVSHVAGFGTLVAPHYHNDLELLWVVSGTLDVHIGEQSIVCSEKDLVFIPPDSLHYAAALDGSAQLQALVFSPSVIIREDLGLFPHMLLRKYTSGHCEFQKNHNLSPSLHHNISRIASLYKLCETDNSAKLELLSHLYAITALLVKSLPINHDHIQDLRRIAPVLEHIGEHYTQHIPLRELSDILHVCDNQLIRIFKSATGTTPTKYITELRLKQAMKLLESTDLPISQIAETVGFSNPNFMAKVFQANLQISPRVFRRNIQE